MCKRIAGPNQKMSFKLIEVKPEKAKIIGTKPGFMYLPLPKKISGGAYTQKQIKKIILWTNAEKGYLGLNYHIWPLHKRLAAHARITKCRLDNFFNGISFTLKITFRKCI